MAFENKIDGRSFAQVLGTKQRLGHMGSNNTCKRKILHHKNSAGIVFSNPLSDDALPRIPKTDDAKITVSVRTALPVSCQDAGVPVYNRFQVLQSSHASSEEVVEDHFQENISTVLTVDSKQSLRKSRFFGHSVGTETNNSFHNSEVFQKCCEQIGTKFGCIPASEIALFDGTPTYWEKIPDIIQAHRLVRDSGLPNF